MGGFCGIGSVLPPRLPHRRRPHAATLAASPPRRGRAVATLGLFQALLVSAGLLLLYTSAAAKLPEAKRPAPAWLPAYEAVRRGPVQRLAPRQGAPLPAVCPRVAETVATNLREAVPALGLRILLTIVPPQFDRGFYMPSRFLQANKAYEKTGDVAGWVFQTTVLATEHQAEGRKRHIVLDPFYSNRDATGTRDGWDDLEPWARNFFGPKTAAERGGPFAGVEFENGGAWVFAFPPDRQRADFEDAPQSGLFGRPPKVLAWEPINLPQLLNNPDHLSVRRTTPWTPAAQAD